MGWKDKKSRENNYLTPKIRFMKKLFSMALGMLLCIGAQAYENTPATFSWAVGNEETATIESDASGAVSNTQRVVGTALTEGERSNLAANNGVKMVTYTPASNKPGAVESAMVEYCIKMKKGVTFTLSNIEYEAIKQGTDGASYSWSYTVDGIESTITEVGQDNILRDNNTSGSPALVHSENITAAAGRAVTVRFYVSGFNAGKLLCLSHLKISGAVNGEEEVRAFKDFKIEFRTNPYSVVLPEGGELPTGVTVSGTTYNGEQHGVQGGVVTVPVDGPVKFTIGACTYSKTPITITKNGEAYAEISNQGACGETTGSFNQFITWTYNVEEAATLVFTFGSQTYVPYFFGEACEFIPEVEVRYYDVDGKTLIGSEIVAGNSKLVYKYGAADVTVAEGTAFRGWFGDSDPTAMKVAEGIALTKNTNLYARTTPIEEAVMGAIYNYDFRPAYFYPEDHEVLALNGGKYNDNKHGWAFSNGNSLSVKVAGNALLVVGVCTYSATGETEVTDGNGNVVGKLSVEKEVTSDGSLQTIQYKGEATTLTLNFTATNYIHSLKVYNISEIPEKNASGYYEIASGDAAALILALETVSDGDKIFLPNGVYDLGEAVLTPISKNNISIIGQSMEGVIIKNAPDFHNEGIGSTATLLVTKNISGTYLQDLTIQNAMDYYGAIAAGLDGGRGVVLQDQGTKTICKNVRLLSYQDTYYSNLSGAVKYFEDCEIHGTVDFICGDGSVYFKNNLLYAEKRNKDGSGSDALTANNGPATDKGYVFEGCTVKSECPIVSFGRAWNNTPSCVFLNTLVDYSAGEFKFEDSKGEIQRWTKALMSANAWPKFGEYNTHLADGTVLTPQYNLVTFIDKKGGNTTQDIETVLTADEAASYTMESTLGDWAATAKADATQAVCDLENIEDDAVYLVEALNGNAELMLGSQLKEEIFPEDAGITVRKANARGGFGYKAGEEPVEEAIENIQGDKVQSTKVLRDGQLLIIRDGKTYNAQGIKL